MWSFSKRYLFRYWPWFLGGFTLVFITQYIAVRIVDQTRQAVDAVNATDAVAQTVMPFVWHIVVLAVLLVIVRTVSRLLVFTPGRLIEYNVRNDYYSRLLHLQRDFLSQHQSGDLVSRCSNDISYIRAAYGFGGLQVANVSVTMGLVIHAMLQLDPGTTLYLVIPMAVSFTIIQTSIRMLTKHWRAANLQVGSMSATVLSAYKGIAAIQNYHAEPAVVNRFAKVNDDYLQTQTVVVTNRAFVMPLVQFVGDLSIFLVLLFAGIKVMDGNLTMGEITAFLGYIGMIMPPLLSLGWMLNVFNQALPAIERLDEILLAEPSLLPPKPTPNLQKDKPVNLELKELSFHYEETKDNPEPFSLDKINLKLGPGKVIGIVGTLGCGKTTLLDSILRLNGPHPGEMFLNGHDAAYISLEDFRNYFSFAPQKAFLFSTTLRKNLHVALDADRASKITDADLMIYLERAGFDLDPKQFPNGLETEVGEKGVMLSGGQRQRIALARALMKEAHIYILDDVLSAVDHETEKRIVGNLRENQKDKAFIIASHRVSAVQWADEILVMDDGRILDRGTHEALVERPGFYQDIFRYQSSHEEGDS